MGQAPLQLLELQGPVKLEEIDFRAVFIVELVHPARWKTLRIKNRTAPAYGVSIATVKGTESLEHAQRLSDALHAIGVQHEIRSISGPEMATISPKFEQGYLYLVIDNYC